MQQQRNTSWMPLCAPTAQLMGLEALARSFVPRRDRRQPLRAAVRRIAPVLARRRVAAQ